MGLIVETVLAYLPAKRKQTPSGWISFNAPCCQDTRQRGGLIINGGTAVSYHCFNCGFKASWQPGRLLSAKMKKFLQSIHVPDDTIAKATFDALRTHDEYVAHQPVIPTFELRALPPDAELITNLISAEVPPKLLPILEYIAGRGLYLEDYPFYWTPKIGFSNRLIIPYFKDGNIVGYTARAVTDVKQRYLSEQQPGYLFNIDAQNNDRPVVIVCEGPIDAICIQGCGLLGSDIKPHQDQQLKILGKEIVFVPDRDHEGPKSVEQALEYNWSVSFPDWPEGVKDINDAVRKLGRITTLWMILQAKESNNLKIQLLAKGWFKNVATKSSQTKMEKV